MDQEASKSTISQPLRAKAELDFQELPLVSQYLDYRGYLNDFYQYKRMKTKGQIRPYSYAMFSAAANVKSPNYLKLIIEGKRNLSKDMAQKFARAMSLNKEQTDEFCTLVNFCQAKDPADRNSYLRELNQLRVNKKLKDGEIDKKVWHRLPGWLGFVVYSMLDLRDVDFSPRGLAPYFRGQATGDQIKEAIDFLNELGFIKKQEDGSYVKASKLGDKPEEIPTAHIRKLQSEFTFLAMESLFRDSAVDREFGSLTLCMTEKEFEELKFTLRQFRKRLTKDYNIQRLQEPGDRVYHLNVQLFPVTAKASQV